MSSVSELLGPILYTRTIPWDDLRGHSLPDSGERAYVMSKTFILMATTRELARCLEGTGVDVLAGDALALRWGAWRRHIQPIGHSWVLARPPVSDTCRRVCPAVSVVAGCQPAVLAIAMLGLQRSFVGVPC
jgi:hypothetical protein